MAESNGTATGAIGSSQRAFGPFGTALIAMYAPEAVAYVGPGAGLGMIAALFAIVVAVLATIVGLVLWPIRKLARRRKAAKVAQAAMSADSDKPG